MFELRARRKLLTVKCYLVPCEDKDSYHADINVGWNTSQTSVTGVTLVGKCKFHRKVWLKLARPLGDLSWSGETLWKCFIRGKLFGLRLKSLSVWRGETSGWLKAAPWGDVSADHCVLGVRLCSTTTAEHRRGLNLCCFLILSGLDIREMQLWPINSSR